MTGHLHIRYNLQTVRIFNGLKIVSLHSTKLTYKNVLVLFKLYVDPEFPLMLRNSNRINSF